MWEDQFIFGEPGYYYIILGERMAGYFHYLRRARAFVRKISR